jgi:formylglycine-generating enzyme required for sulfatase activity
MSKIFISYRREDSADVTGRIYDYLTPPIGTFQPSEVFKDVDSIPLGVNFKKHLESMVEKCAMQLVVIGPQWLTVTDKNGKRRLDDPTDFVRIEVESALVRGIPVIPLLVMGAAMPTENDLPATLGNLSFQNGMPIRRDPDFRHDMNRLVKALESWLKELPLTRTVLPTSPTLLMSHANLPALEWFPIKSGNVTLESGGYISKEKQTFAVPSFTVSKYPITNKQFAEFVKADGYSNHAWWTHQGWKFREQRQWKQPRYWNDKTLNQSEHPVVGISWFEAIAFCGWMSEAVGETVMLPTEQQWQRAAEHDSQSSVINLSGNVWEWCITDYENGTHDMNALADKRVVRGGPFMNFEGIERSAARNKVNVDNRNNDVGFRVVHS